MGNQQQTVHIIGAGLAGLATAVDLIDRGYRVILSEAAGHGGGRCRSYHDKDLDCLIDNGNHLLLSGNWAVNGYLAKVGAADQLTGPERAEFSFIDLRTGERWALQPNQGKFPWWLFCPTKRIPGTKIGDYLKGYRLSKADPGQTIKDVLGETGLLYERFWKPLAVSVLNTECDQAQAALLWPVLKETFGAGEAAYRPRVAKTGLSETFVHPAIDYLKAKGAEVSFNRRLKSLVVENEKIVSLDFTDGLVDLAASDKIVLAVTAPVAATLLPGLTVPDDMRAIVNAHFHFPAPLDDKPFMTGVIGGVGDWVFVRGRIASVTVSAADDLATKPAEEIQGILWAEVARVLDLDPVKRPPCRIVKEKRATFAQTPANIAKRPKVQTSIANLALAGDWVDNGLPATIEGALRSGLKAAETVVLMG